MTEHIQLSILLNWKHSVARKNSVIMTEHIQPSILLNWKHSVARKKIQWSVTVHIQLSFYQFYWTEQIDLVVAIPKYISTISNW